MEFVLGLDAYKIAIEKTAVQTEITRVRAAWTTLRTQTAKLATAAAGLLNAIPADPVSSWPPEVPPEIMIARGKEWIALPTYFVSLRQRLAELQAEPVPQSQAVEPRVRTELAEAESQLADRELAITVLVENIQSETSEIAALETRIESIEDDLRKYKDVRKLRNLGSADEPESAKGTCPTCHQELADSLLDLGKKATPMSLDQNISFYQEQLQLFTAVLANAKSALKVNEAQLQAHRIDIDKLRQNIRSLRDTLVASSTTPSIEMVAERIRLESRIATLEGLLANFEDSLSEFAQLASEWKAVQERRASLPKGDLSQSDENKVNTLEASLRRQLTSYHMGSVDPAEVSISRDHYGPEKAGLNLGADISASDLIRLQWAYLLGLLEIGLSNPTNHLGLLIMDEPQQQSVEESAFRAMLEYAANFKKAQILIGTSHERTTINNFLKSINVPTIYEYEDSRIIGPLKS